MFLILSIFNFRIIRIYLKPRVYLRIFKHMGLRDVSPTQRKRASDGTACRHLVLSLLIDRFRALCSVAIIFMDLALDQLCDVDFIIYWL
jgi:hypothetical protein